MAFSEGFEKVAVSTKTLESAAIKAYGKSMSLGQAAMPWADAKKSTKKWEQYKKFLAAARKKGSKKFPTFSTTEWET